MRSIPHGRPIVFGEVLFDHFPDRRSVLGGAPFNVAWHLQGFGAQPLFVSRIGDDSEGRIVGGRMTEWGMDLAGLQTDPTCPTGAVEVTFDHGDPSFNIIPDQAYDHIDTEQAVAAVHEVTPALLYHGSLIARAPESAAALGSLRADPHLPVFVDVNLRPPWWTSANVTDALSRASWAKLNHDELTTLAGGGDPAAIDPQAFLHRYTLRALIVTRGAQGATVVTDAGVSHGEPVPVPDLVDTVGAGDAFSAVMIMGLLKDWPLPTALRRALAFASAICGIRGATSADRTLYDRHLRAWSAPAG
jgi:fructokinase